MAKIVATVKLFILRKHCDFERTPTTGYGISGYTDGIEAALEPDGWCGSPTHLFFFTLYLRKMIIPNTMSITAAPHPTVT